MTPAPVRRSGVWALLAVPLAGLLLLALPHPPLTRDAAFRVVEPRDGAAVRGAVTVSWTEHTGASGYAVAVDVAPPRPGGTAASGPHLLVVSGRRLALVLGSARTGSPSARAFHTLTVVPLDADGRRSGEAAATVHVRERP